MIKYARQGFSCSSFWEGVPTALQPGARDGGHMPENEAFVWVNAQILRQSL